MSTILVVDDMAVFREPIAAIFRHGGHRAVCASSGREALAAAASDPPDLVLADVAMPLMDGLTLVEHLRRDPRTAKVPIILLTAVADKSLVVRAGTLGVQGYLLKAHFSLQELLERVDRLLRANPADDPDAAAGAAAGAASTVARPGAPAGVDGVRGRPNPGPSPDGDSPVPRLLTREETVERVEQYAGAKTLAGVVAEVIALASSPRGRLADLVAALKRDPMLAARVLQLANSASFASNKSRVTTVEDAVRNVGLNAVRNLAASVGVFDALPPDGRDGFNLIRCWQHCFAAAAIMDRLAQRETGPPGVAHLIGLCHDLGEIVLRQRFATEYAAAIEAANRTGKPLQQVEATVFGVSHAELVGLVLGRLGLPPAISGPIREYFEGTDGTGDPVRLGAAAQALRLANLCSHGLLLASSAEAAVAPLSQAECRAALGELNPPPLNGEGLRSEVLTATALLARLSPADEARLSQPLIARRPVRLWYARHPSFARLDPLGLALELLAQTEVHDRLPAGPDEAAQCDAIVVAVPRQGISAFTCSDAERVSKNACKGGRGNPLPVLYLLGSGEPPVAVPGAGVQPKKYPISLATLADFVRAVDESPIGSARTATLPEGVGESLRADASTRPF